MEFHSYSSTCAFSSINAIKDKHVTVMGLGLNGGGEAAVRFFLKKGAYVLVTDMKTEEQLKPTIERLNSDPDLDTSRLTYRLGEHRIEDFENADCVIKNPGVKYEGNKYLAAAKAIETDLSIFLRFTECPIIAVTGSKGKSSTVSAIYYGLKEAGYKTFLGGNITVSPLTFIDEVSSDTPVVIEFSSWQLSDLRGRKVLKPHISIITKIVPDHQNWYGNMEDYVADKRLIYADQDSGDYSIFDAGPDEPGTGPKCGGTWGDLFAKESKATVLRYDAENPRYDLGKLLVPGKHMQTNAQNAALVMQLMNVPKDKIKEILQRWPGIDHRLQYFHSWKNKNGVTYKFYNDTCATVPEAAAAATQAFETPVILITGGTDKGLELNKFTETVINNDGKFLPVKEMYFLAGTATDKILPELDKAKVKYNGPFNSLCELLDAVKKDISEKDGKDEIVVFSPGATSFGMFSNEFDRGNQFMNGIKERF
ncbi:MAG: UDP-N-acetylmuramoyl-L-alanine--D-glutamate ligase [Treponema sp.]|nr:UDP-N-acetylmuramoyl-L-alanine--D-glutamate ligase [Treponema sp.]